MTRGVQAPREGGITPEFASVSTAAKTCGKAKSSTLSIRLSPEERAELEAQAGDAPLGRHIKDQMFRAQRRGAGIADRQALARVLRALADSNLAMDLAAVARASEAGEIGVSEGLNACLNQACSDVAAMRKDLIKALGLRPK